MPGSVQAGGPLGGGAGGGEGLVGGGACGVRRFEGAASEFEPAAIRSHAERFAVPRYHRELQAALNEAVARGPIA